MLLHNELYTEDLLTIVRLDIPWSRLSNRSILITGARGMIGSFLVDTLVLRNELYNEGIKVYALGRNEEQAKTRFADYIKESKITFINHDVNNPIPSLGNIDYIVHAASNTHPLAYVNDPIGTITTNVLGTYNLLNYAIANNAKRFMLLSSVEIYGENRGDTEYFDESYCGYIDCNTLRAGYPESKRLGEALCNAFAEMYKIETVIVRLSRVYGPTMLPDDSKAVAQFITNAIQEKDVVVKSSGNQLFSYCYVADAVSGLLTVLLSGQSKEAYNVAGLESDVALRTLAEVIASIGKVRTKFEPPDEKEQRGYSQATKALLDISKVKSLGWEPKYTLEEGIKRTYEIMRTLSYGSQRH